MIVRGKIIKNAYRDSIALMRIANELCRRPNVDRADVLMATPTNLDALEHRSLILEELKAATPNDIVISVEAENEQTASEALEWAEEQITKRSVIIEPSIGGSVSYSLSSAKKKLPDANLALISIPGSYVKREALRALDLGMNLLIFSDNVPIEDELEIKMCAQDYNLLVMGPDCGTAFISGGSLAFANHIRRGPIGIVAASGTGMQEVSCLIHRAGSGISHGIGTGSNDIKDSIGGLSFLSGLDLLESDASTEVIVILTKPPELQAQKAILDRVKQSLKPVVVNFLGSPSDRIEHVGAIPASTLEDAARIALDYTGVSFSLDGFDRQAFSNAIEPLNPDQQYVRGIFVGGTFTTEAALILCQSLDDVFSNTRLPQAHYLNDPFSSIGHTCVDMGEDIFTRGKPHPMLDPTIRNQRILQEASDPETSVILLDVVLGYGVDPNPAASILETLKQFLPIQNIPVVASVCGTDEDPQGRKQQVEVLESAGVIVMPSNASAAKMAAAIATRNLGVLEEA